jgi:hypothetical protein
MPCRDSDRVVYIASRKPTQNAFTQMVNYVQIGSICKGDRLTLHCMRIAQTIYQEVAYRCG